MMTCPECGAKITYVKGYFEARRNVYIKENGSIIDYDSDIVALPGDYEYECPECCEDITGAIKE